MNMDAWNTKDKSWVKQRKQDWQDILIRLQHSEEFTKKQLKSFESYYLRGREPKWDIQFDNDPLPLIIRLWLHPDQSEENWNRIRDAVLNYPDPMVIHDSLSESFKIYYEADNAVSYSGHHKTPNSFMNGLEEKMYLILYGSPESSEYMKFHGEEFYAIRRFNGSYYANNRDWLSYKRLIGRTLSSYVA